jgi:predicted secreted protein
MAKVPGYQIVLQLDTKKLVGYRTHSMDVEADMADSTTGASTNQWKENMPLFKGAEFSVGGLYDPATGGSVTTFDGAFSILAAGTKVVAKFGNTTVNSKYYQADAYIRHVHIEGPHDDLASYTLDLVVTGKITQGTV